ncbi:MAG: hypothetical protein WA876_07095 [Candidatus Acidiferrales bacterium]
MASAQEIASNSGQRNFFAKSPFFSFGFVLNTTVLALCLGLSLYFLLKFWNLVDGPMFFVLFAPAWMFSSWIGALRSHGRLRDLFNAGLIHGVEPQSPLGISLEVAEEGLNRNLLYSFLSNMVLLAAILGVLLHRL